MNQISQEQVKHIAELSKLDVTGEEEKFSKLLSDTLDYIDVLDELDTSATSPTFQVGGSKNVFQEDDAVTATLSQEDAVSNGSDVINNLFGTEGVFSS